MCTQHIIIINTSGGRREEGGGEGLTVFFLDFRYKFLWLDYAKLFL